MAVYRDNPIIPIYGARPTYINKLLKYGLFPLFISPSSPKEVIDEAYKISDGAFFIGGEDFDPKFYGAKKHPKTFVGEAERDDLEIYLLKKILKDKKPYLGICRGCQALAIASGGNLIQHLPAVLRKEFHGFKPGQTYDDFFTNPKHSVLIDRSGRLYRIMQKTRVLVNSWHHQAVDNPGKNINVVARSPAGIIEALEHSDRQYFCFGVQGHAEVEENSFFEDLFREFAKAVKKYKK